MARNIDNAILRAFAPSASTQKRSTFSALDQRLSRRALAQSQADTYHRVAPRDEYARLSLSSLSRRNNAHAINLQSTGANVSTGTSTYAASRSQSRSYGRATDASFDPRYDDFTDYEAYAPSASNRWKVYVDTSYDDDFDGTFDEEAYAPARYSARDQRKRSRLKDKAAKLFEKQFASLGNDAASDDAPRAALYKGEMGAMQRKSARMQRVSEAGPVSAKFDMAGWFSQFHASRKSIFAVTLVLTLVLSVAFLYSPAKLYYESVREHDRLVAEYAAVQDRNHALASQNEALASDAGLEDAIRTNYGYVCEGEQTARVSGLSQEALDSSSRDDAVAANVLSSSIDPPDYWYTPLLDTLFGVR